MAGRTGRGSAVICLEFTNSTNPDPLEVERVHKENFYE